MLRIRTIKRALIIFVFIAAFFADTGRPWAAEQYYTIQTGTYTPIAIFFASRQFDMLTQKLKESELDGLRICKTTKFLLVRIGRFKSIDDAKKILQVVRPLVADAYILIESNTGDMKVVRTYNAPSVPAEYYTILIGDYVSKEDAYRQFDRLAKALIKKDLEDLRIEKAGKLFSVRTGRFTDYAAAKKFLAGIGPLVPGADVIKAERKDEQIVRLYDAATPETTAAQLPDQEENAQPSTEQPADKKPSGTYVKIQTEKVEDLLNNISSQYYEQNYEKAAELLKQGIEKFPYNADLYAWYGATLLNIKSPDMAYEVYTKAVELSPDVPDYHAGVGYSLLNIYMDRAKGAIDAFNAALALDPNNIDALEGLGIVYVSIDKKDLAADIYNRLKDLNADAAKRLNTMMVRGVDWGK